MRLWPKMNMQKPPYHEEEVYTVQKVYNIGSKVLVIAQFTQYQFSRFSSNMYIVYHYLVYTRIRQWTLIYSNNT